MLRSILATVVGFTVSVIVITLFDSVGFALFPAEAITDPQQLSNAAQQAPAKTLPAILWGVLRYAAGTTCGVFVATYYGRPHRLPAMLVTAFLVTAVLWVSGETAQPMSLQAASIIAVLFGAFTGFGLAAGKGSKPKDAA